MPISHLSSKPKTAVRTATSYRNSDGSTIGVTTQVMNLGTVAGFSDSLTKSDLVRTVKDGVGWRRPTAYGLTRETWSDWYGSYSNWRAFTSWKEVYEYDGYSTLLDVSDRSVPSFPFGLEARAVAECLVKLKQQNVNYAVAAAEARKSIGLVGEALMRVAKSAKLAKKLRWRQSAAALGFRNHTFTAGQKDVAGRWLELQYGWLPLLDDCWGALEDLEQGLTRLQPRLSVTRTIKVPIKGSHSEVRNDLRRHYRYKGGSEHGVRVRLDYTINNSALATGTKIGLTNPALVVWELAPFSFLVDWVLPIGTWLETLDADFGLTFAGGTKTTFTRVKRTGKIAYSSHNGKPAGQWLNVNVDSNFDYFKMSRSVYLQTPIAIPYLKDPFSTGHALNAVALMRSLI